MFKPGFQFTPGYRIEKFLGRGQFGQVWQVEAPGGTSAAVKFIDLTEGSSQKEYEGIKRVKQIRQANLMPITAIWQLDQFGKAIGLSTSEFAGDVAQGNASAFETMDEISVAGLQPDQIDPNIAEPNPVNLRVGSSDESQYQATTSFEALPEPAWLAVAMLLGGKSLRHVMRDYQKQGQPGIPFDELISYMQDAAKGLDFLNQPNHDLGSGPVAIQHCDVKPANIVTIGNSAVVCDFGLAKILTRNQATATSAAGTPAYMAPEAIGGQPSKTSDQYSLAITFCELRTGKMPVEGNSVWEVIDKHRQGQLNFSALPEAELNVLRKATHLDWKSRYESCSEMVDHLRDAHRGIAPIVPSGFGFPAKTDGPATGPALPSMEETTDFSLLENPPTKKNRRAIGWVVVAAVALIAGPAFYLWSKPDSSLDAVAKQTSTAGPTQAAEQIQPSNDTQRLKDESAQGPTQPDSTEEMLAEAIDWMGRDQNQAVKRFEKLLDVSPSYAAPTARVIPGSDSLQRIWPVKRSQILALGYKPNPTLVDLEAVSSDSTSKTLAWKRDGEGMIYPQAVALSPDRTQIALGGIDAAKRWDLESANSTEPIALPGISGEVLAMAWHPNRPFLVAATDDGAMHVWEIRREESARHRQFSTAWIADELLNDSSENWLVCRTDDGDVQAIKWAEIITSLDVQQSPESHSLKSTGTEARIIASLSLDDRPTIAVGDDDGVVTLWDVSAEPNMRKREHAHKGSVEAITVSTGQQGQIVASCGSDGSVHVWNVSTTPPQSHMFSLGDQPLSTLAVSPDQRWIATGGFGAAWLRDWTVDETRACKLPVGQTTVTSVVIDPDGRYIVAACADGSISIWDLRHAQLHAITQRKVTLDKPTTKL